MYEGNEKMLGAMPKIREHWQGEQVGRPTAQHAIGALFSRLGTLEKLAAQLEDKLSYALSPPQPISVEQGHRPLGQEPARHQDSELMGAITNLGSQMDDLSARLSELIRRAQV